MEIKELDSLQYAVQILNGIRDIMMLMEGSAIKEIPASACIVLETAIEKSVSLLDGVAVGKEVTGDESQ